MPPDVSEARVPATRPAGGPLAASAITVAYRALAATWRFRFHGREILQRALDEGPAILALWHGEQLPMVISHAHMGLLGMASLSPDGELLARVIGRLGFGVVRGSSSRGGGQAWHESVAAVQQKGLSPVLAVDGPRGPFHVPHHGVITLAARTGRPIVFGVSRARPALRISSWDRFVLPLPLARVDVYYGRMEAPQPDGIEEARQELARRMEALVPGFSSSAP